MRPSSSFGTALFSLFTLLSLSLLGGCSDDDATKPDGATGDLASKVDATTGDGPARRDALADKGPVWDGAARDAAGDAAAGDAASKDARAADARLPDAPAADLPTPDTGPDAFVPPTAPCASGRPRFSYGPAMVVCTGTARTQCDAKSICSASWHVCSASEFLARGGRTINPGLADDAWIAGCIRDGSQPFAPVDGNCSCAAGSGSGATPVGWSCSDGSPTLFQSGRVLGITNAQACRRIGVNLAAHAARWRSRVVDDKSQYAVCCY